MMAGLRRSHSGVDTYKEHPDARPDAIAQWWKVLYNWHVGNWLVKEEPEHYSYDALVREGRTVWAGVRNPLAQKHLRSIRKGDRIFYYHTGKEKAVVAIAKATSDAYPDPKDKDGKLSVVDIVPERKLDRPVTLAEIKADAAFASFPLVRMSRLSVMPVTDSEWKRIEKLSHA
jgi:predicted RNA-binding protein with PUA-like domain